jgi:leader peptidase (prepilin peptidase)/N-methyltransferase
VTLPWIIGAAVAGVLAGPPVRAGVLARYGVAPPALAVEAAAGLALAVTAARAASPWPLAGLGWLMLCAVALAFIDAAIRRLPDPLTGAAFAGTLGFLAVAALTGGGHPGQLGRAVLAAAALCGFYLALFIIRPSGMGLGDVKLAAGIGTALGWLGWQALVAGTFLAFALAAVYGMALLISGRATRKHQIPFGPFMITGAFLVFLAGVLYGLT